MRSTISAILIALTAILWSSCSNNEGEKAMDQTAYETIDQYAGQYAQSLEAVADNDLELENLILDIRSREYRLRTELGEEAADRFIKSLADSIRAIDKSLAANLNL